MSSLKKATLIATSTAFMLALLKMTIGVIGNSASVIASAIDSLLDIFISLFNYFAISKSEKAPSKMFNYGLGKIEGFACGNRRKHYYTLRAIHPCKRDKKYIFQRGSKLSNGFHCDYDFIYCFYSYVGIFFK